MDVMGTSNENYNDSPGSVYERVRVEHRVVCRNPDLSAAQRDELARRLTERIANS
tara:strand:- start:69 stop:233 length:165 start_codon:yes stop_codon:yes gene_type:complete